MRAPSHNSNKKKVFQGVLVPVHFMDGEIKDIYIYTYIYSYAYVVMWKWTTAANLAMWGCQ